ncbi:M1 family aminopeptidase [Polymorphobacter sp.]|uniref:M1 family metallopeptidase n=1 Tax=Polymorphobacter sp. TaxID=1909290 RepID=UPI003F71A635
MRVLLFSLLFAVSVQAQPVPVGRLPDGIKPLAYSLAFTIDPSQERFSGQTAIDVEVQKPTTLIYLHGQDLEVSRAELVSGGKRITARYSQVDASGVARLDLVQPVPAGPARIEISYSAGFRKGAEGIFRAKVGNDWYAWTQMEPLDARRAFPGFDEPGFKTPFTISLTVPKAMKAFANTPETGVQAAGAMVTHRFAPSKPLPTYLVALGVGAFDVRGVTIPANAVRKVPLEFRVIGTAGQAGRMDITLEETPKLLARLEDYFGIPYPYEKLDFIASPVQGGAMENAGLILYSDNLILLGRDAPFGQLRRFAEVVSHEMAHQWFGDLVTPDWWTDIWLNEAFAEWMGKRIAHAWRPDLGIDPMELDEAFGAMDLDSLGRGRPIRQEITENSQVASAFDGITYQKGAQVVSMFEGFVGAEAFQKGVRLHLNRYAFRNAKAEQFFESIAEAAKDPRVIPALNSFLTQTGVPLLAVADGTRSIELAQARYVPLGVAAPAAQTWQIPYCLSRGEGRRCDLLATDKARVPALIGTSLALNPNAEGKGYYRYTMDEAGWTRLIADAPGLSGRDAMALADSLWADFSAGRASFPLVLRAAEALAGHPERLAAGNLAGRLAGLGNRLIPAADQQAYRATMGRIYGPAASALGFDPRHGAYAAEPADRQSRRQTLVPVMALEARDPAIRKALAEAGGRLIAGDAEAVDPTWRALALSVAVQEGGEPVMRALSRALIASDEPLFRGQAASAIGAVATPEQAKVALELAFAEGMQPLETTGLVASVSRQPAGREAAVAFAEANFTRLMNSYPGFAKRNIVGLFSGFCSNADAARVEALVEPRLVDLGGGELELSQAVAGIRRCDALKAAKGAEISSALRQ